MGTDLVWKKWDRHSVYGLTLLQRTAAKVHLYHPLDKGHKTLCGRSYTYLKQYFANVTSVCLNCERLASREDAVGVVSE